MYLLIIEAVNDEGEKLRWGWGWGGGEGVGRYEQSVRGNIAGYTTQNWINCQYDTLWYVDMIIIVCSSLGYY